jgi:hypothetical protein
MDPISTPCRRATSLHASQEEAAKAENAHVWGCSKHRNGCRKSMTIAIDGGPRLAL